MIKPVFLHTFKICNKEIGKPDESLGRKAIGPVKWQPVALNDVYCLHDSFFYAVISMQVKATVGNDSQMYKLKLHTL